MMRFASAALRFLLAFVLSAAAHAEGIPGVGDAELKAALAALISAEEVVTGTHERPEWLMDRLRDHAANDPQQKIQRGDFKYTDAFAMLVEYQSQYNYGMPAIDRAVMDATGHPARAADFDAWYPQVVAKKAWYVTIRAAEIKKAQADPYLRRYAVEAAYLHVFGRVPTAAELQYWMPRVEGWRDMSNANRTWLYSAGGAAELPLTLARAQRTYSSAFAPSSEQLLAASRAQLFTYDRMTQWLRERH